MKRPIDEKIVSLKLDDTKFKKKRFRVIIYFRETTKLFR